MPNRRRLRADGPKAVVLAPVRPNAGFRAAYQRRMDALMTELHDSLVYWLTAAWRKEPTLAEDATAADRLQRSFQNLDKRWTKRLDAMAPKLAAYFATQVNKRVENVLSDTLRTGGFTVRFQYTEAMKTAYAAVVEENVGLIKSIAAKHLGEVQGHVMRSVAAGRDLGTLTKELHENFGVTKRRAALIAKTENNKATAVFARTRALDLGITHAVWKHSHGGNHPRPSHVAADGTVYEIEKGWFDPDEQAWILPGELINCLPGDTLVHLVDGCHVVWRYDYRGDLITLEAGEATVSSTPNHPFLTSHGWVAAEAINEGDYVWQARHKEFQAGVRDVNETHARIDDVFDALGSVSGVATGGDGIFDFHGDVPNAEVQAVRADGLLLRKGHVSGAQGSAEFDFPQTDTGASIGVPVAQVPHSRAARFGRDLLALFGGGAGKTQETGLGAGPDVDTLLLEPADDRGSRSAEVLGDCQDAIALVEHSSDVRRREILETLARSNTFSKHDPLDDLRAYAEMLGHRQSGIALAVQVDNGVKVQVDALERGLSVSGFDGVALGPEVLAQLVRVNVEMGGDTFEAGEFAFQAIRVSKKLVRENKSGHVYTLQSNCGWYGTTAENLVSQNCRCVSKPIVEGFE